MSDELLERFRKTAADSLSKPIDEIKRGDSRRSRRRQPTGPLYGPRRGFDITVDERTRRQHTVSNVRFSRRSVSQRSRRRVAPPGRCSAALHRSRALWAACCLNRRRARIAIRSGGFFRTQRRSARRSSRSLWPPRGSPQQSGDIASIRRASARNRVGGLEPLETPIITRREGQRSVSRSCTL